MVEFLLSVLIALLTLVMTLVLASLGGAAFEWLGLPRIIGFVAAPGLALWMVNANLSSNRRWREPAPAPASTPEPDSPSTITVRARDGIAIIAVVGHDSTDAWRAFDDRLREVLEGGGRSILVDLSRLGSLNADGVGTLVRAMSTARAAGAAIKVSAPSPHVRGVLEVTLIATALEIHPDEETAVASFG